MQARVPVALWLALLLSPCAALNNGLGLTPPLGYNTWNDFQCANITAENIRLVADKMIELGFRDVGYTYLNIDDCWAVSRDAVTKRLVPDPKAFPDGMKVVVDYVHAKGFKFGIYSDRGPMTCARRPGSKGHEMLDAQTFADWGVDFLKEDSCFSDSVVHERAFAQYARMRDALNATGRPIFFSLCGWRAWYAPVGASLGNSWRITGDVTDWEGVYAGAQAGAQLGKYAGPGGFNDPDMLIGSTPGAFFSLTPDQSRTQFNLWVILAAPLLVGSSMLRMSPHDRETYTNPEAIAVSQDVLAKPGFLAWSNCPKGKQKTAPACAQVLSKPLSSGGFALVLANYADAPQAVACAGACVERACGGGGCAGSLFLVRDVWAGKSLGLLQSVEATLPAGGSAMFVFSNAQVPRKLREPVPAVL